MNNIEAFYKKLYKDIVRGYTICFKDRVPFFIKHISHLDISDLSEIYIKYYEAGLEQGLSKEKDIIKNIMSSGKWTKAQDEELQNKQMFIDGMEKSIKKQHLPSQRKKIEEDIKLEKESYQELLNYKKNLIGKTAEDYAEKKFNEYCLFYTVYTDQSLRNRYFNEDNIDYLEDDELNGFYQLILEANGKFTEENLKKLSLQSFFINLLSLSENSIYKFYNKAITELSNYQIHIFINGMNFKKIFEQYGEMVPLDYREDPDKLLSWFEAKQNAEATLSKKKDNAVQGFVGGSQEDYKALGYDTYKWSDQIKKAGGKLGLDDISDIINK